MKADDKQWFDAYEVQGRQMGQVEANYNPLGMSSEKGCANCRWFIGPGACVLVGGGIAPTGICDYWMAPAQVSDVMSEAGVSEVTVEATVTTDDLSAGERATWSTAYKNSLPDSSFLYIEPGGSKDGEGKTVPRTLRHFPVKDANGKPDEAHIIDALGRIPQSGVSAGAKSAALSRARAMAKRAGITVAAEKSLGVTVKDMITNFVSLVRSTDEVGNVLGLKEVDGRTRFMCTYTNCFKDKERSIFATAAHKSYSQWVERTGAYPELWIWHTPGTRLGVADWVAESSGLLFASGLIDEGQELRAYNLAASKDLGMSHGYLYGNVEGDVIKSYRSYEMSLLPRANAANEATTFQLLGEKEMFSEAQKAFLLNGGLYTEEEVARLEEGAAEFKGHMQKLGVDMKDTEQEAATDMQLLIKGQMALVDAVSALTKGLGEVQQQVVVADEKATAAQKSLEDAVADTMQAQVSRLPQGQKATESDDNVVAEEKVTADLSWFDQAMSSIGTAAGIGGR